MSKLNKYILASGAVLASPLAALADVVTPDPAALGTSLTSAVTSGVGLGTTIAGASIAFIGVGYLVFFARKGKK